VAPSTTFATNAATSHRPFHIATSAPEDIPLYVTEVTGDVTSAIHELDPASDTRVRQAVTSPYTDYITTLKPISHSSLTAISIGERTTLGLRKTIADSATTDSNVTTAPQRVGFVTSASTTPHRSSHLATSVTTPRRRGHLATNITQQTDSLPSVETFNTKITLTSSVRANTAEDYLSSSVTSTQDATDAPATLATRTTSGHVDASVTSQTDVISDAAESISRDGMMTSSSFSSVSDAGVEVISHSSLASTQSPVNVVSDSSLLTSVSVGSTLAGSAVNDVLTQSSVSSTSAVRNVHTDTLTASSVLSTLLTSDASRHDMTSATHSVAAANDSSAKQFVTSPYTDDITSLSHASHSLLGTFSSSKKITVGFRRTIDDSAITHTNVTTARQRIGSVTSASTLSYPPDRLPTSAPVSATSITTPHRPSQLLESNGTQQTEALTSADSFTAEMILASSVHANTAEDYLSSSFTSTQDATDAPATLATSTTSGHVDASVTSQTGVISAAAEEISRDGMMASSSFSSVSDAADETVSRLSPMSTQSPVTVAYNSSQLSSVSVGGTLAGSAVSDVSTQSSVSSTSAVRSVHTDTLTASSVLSTLLTSDASRHDMTSATHSVAAANDSSVKQFVTSPYTDVNTSFRRASHSTLGAITRSERTTVTLGRTTAESDATDSNVTTARQSVGSVTSASTTPHISSHVAASAPVSVTVTTTSHRSSHHVATSSTQQTEALTSADSFTAEIILSSSVHANTAEDYLSSSVTSTQDATDVQATLTTITTSEYMDTSVTSQTGVTSAAAEEISRDGMMTSSSFSSVSDAADETVSRLSPVSTQSPVNVVSDSSLLTSVSVGGTLAGSAVSDVSTQSSVSSTSAVRNVHTDTLTASSVLSTLLTSDASKHHMTSASHSVSEVNDTSVRQSVTSPYTDVVTSLRRASHSSLEAISSSERTMGERLTTLADSAATDRNVTTARQRVVSVTSRGTTPHRSSDIETSTYDDVTVHITELTDDMTSASHSVAASSDTNVKQTVTSPYTGAEIAVTSLTPASHSSLAPISSTNTDDRAGSRPHTTLSIPHTRTMSRSVSSIDTDRHSQSHSSVQLSSSYVTSRGSSIVTSVNSSRGSSSSSSDSGGEVDLTVTALPDAISAAPVSETDSSLSNVTHDSSAVEQFSATLWSRDNASSTVAPTAMSTNSASTHSMLGLHSVADDQSTITRHVVNTSSHTVTTIPQVSASKQTTKSHQLNTTSFYGMLLSARVSSDGTSAEPDSSTSSWSEWVTDRMTSGTSPSPASRLDTTQVTRYLSSDDSVDSVSAFHTSTRQPPLPSTAHHQFSSLVTLNYSSNVTSRSVLDDSTEPSHEVMSPFTSSSLSTVNEPHSTEISTVPSFTANVSHYTSVNISSNYRTHQVTDSLSQLLSTALNMMNVTEGPSTPSTSSINLVDHHTYETLTDTATSAADSGESTQSQLYVSEPRQSSASSSLTSAADSSESTQSQLYISEPRQSSASSSLTLSVATSVHETTRSRPLLTTTQDTGASIYVTTGRRHRTNTGRRARGRHRSHVEHMVFDKASVTVNHLAR